MSEHQQKPTIESSNLGSHGKKDYTNSDLARDYLKYIALIRLDERSEFTPRDLQIAIAIRDSPFDINKTYFEQRRFPKIELPRLDIYDSNLGEDGKEFVLTQNLKSILDYGFKIASGANKKQNKKLEKIVNSTGIF